MTGVIQTAAWLIFGTSFIIFLCSLGGQICFPFLSLSQAKSQLFRPISGKKPNQVSDVMTTSFRLVINCINYSIKRNCIRRQWSITQEQSKICYHDLSLPLWDPPWCSPFLCELYGLLYHHLSEHDTHKQLPAREKNCPWLFRGGMGGKRMEAVWGVMARKASREMRHRMIE